MTDFPAVEFEARLARAQTLMAAEDFDAILLTTEAEVRYFTGFRSLFWQSPTRPWFVILPQSGAPVAVIPAIGADLMGRTWVSDIRSWPSPRGFDEGINLLVEALIPYRRIGLPMGEESSLRMPLTDFQTLKTSLKAEFADCTPLIKSLRMVKSDAEIAILKDICQIGSRAFARVPEFAQSGTALSEVFRRFRIALLEEGAEETPYLVGGAGPGGYTDVISPPDETPLAQEDVLMLDTGASLKGYFCDFDRNFAIGTANDAARAAHARLWDATEAAFDMARAGKTMADLFAAMQGVLKGGSDVGRFGHGLGMQLTEWPSIAAHDHTELQAGMVLTLEPSLMLDETRMMVAEENILITNSAPVLLTQRAPRELPVI
ncbi:M24 family metallopeptidase [Neptunicoccus cionae]|uniref:M24 family metallopeptidase n=1 Tax=Neptunicoccus cionae TaxID=2035344 RepID=UPI000C792959|nr:Xaa-Pro peptidase family protein [Amylibacter cionae]PLS23540.1 peptidase M24 [Amylibacter cionae]